MFDRNWGAQTPHLPVGGSLPSVTENDEQSLRPHGSHAAAVEVQTSFADSRGSVSKTCTSIAMFFLGTLLLNYYDNFFIIITKHFMKSHTLFCILLKFTESKTQFS